jgi:tyrosine-specific transport protein
MRNGSLLATGLLAGTVIGAGIFSLPYVFARLGFVASLVFLAGFCVVYTLLHRMYADLLVSAAGRHQFAYLAERYLPKWLAPFAAWSAVLELVFVLLVYLVLAPSFAELVVPGSAAVAFWVFWVLGSLFIFLKLDWLGVIESLCVGIIIAIVLAVFVLGCLSSGPLPAREPFSLAAFFLPFGPLLFSLSGRPAISKVVEEHRRATHAGHPFSLNKVILLGTAIPAVVYLVFVFGVLRLSPAVTPDAVSGLSLLPPWVLAAFGILGFVSMWKSYLMIGTNARDILRDDFRVSKGMSALVVLATPLILVACGLDNFLVAVGVTGGIFLALEGMFIVTMWYRAFPEHRWRRPAPLLALIFIAAIIYEALNLAL